MTCINKKSKSQRKGSTEKIALRGEIPVTWGDLRDRTKHENVIVPPEGETTTKGGLREGEQLFRNKKSKERK